MANNITNITLPDGTALTVPAWATETTLQAMMMIAQRAGVLSKGMLKGIKGQSQNDKDILEAIQKSFDGIKTNTSSNEEQVKGKAGMLLKGAQQIKDTATFFGNSEKPLTSLVKATESLVDKMEGPNGKGGLGMLGKKFKGLGKFMEGFGGQVVGVASDIVLALAGWNAAKFEQFAEVQKKMIDSGAIMYKTGDMFDQLYKDSFQAGVTYNAFSEVVANFGGTMTAIGGDVSQGGVQFLKMFKKLSVSTDSLGDLGMLNNELMNTYAGYIETQRLTGAIDRKLAGNGAGLETSFKNLVVETTALASMTSLNRGDALNRQFAALSNDFLAAGAQTLRDKGLDKTAAMAESMMTQMALFSDQGQGAEAMQDFEQAFNKAVLEFSGNIGNFDMSMNMSDESRSAFKRIMPGFLTKIEGMVREAEDLSELPANFMLQEFDKMDKEKIAGANAAPGSAMSVVAALQQSGILVDKNMGEWTKLTLKEMRAVVTKSEKALDTSGATTVAMNDMAKMFLTAQEFITLPMQKFGDILETVTGFIEESATNAQEISNNLFEGYTLNDNGSEVIDEVTEMKDGPHGFNQDGTKSIIPAQRTIFGIKNKSLAELNKDLTDRQDQYKILTSGGAHFLPQNKGIAKINREIKALEAQIELLTKMNAAEDKRALNESNVVWNEKLTERYS